MQNLAPIFNTKRMVAEYAEQLYFPAHRRWQHLNETGGKRSIALTRWKTHIQDHWGDLPDRGETHRGEGYLCDPKS